MTRATVHPDPLQAAWEAFLLMRAMGGNEYEALLTAIEACNAGLAEAAREAIHRKLRHAEAA